MFKRPAIEVITSGFEPLDQALGINGFPKGKIIEIAGEEDSYKTFTALNMISSMQSQGLIALYIDVDRRLNTEILLKNQIDSDSFVLLYENDSTKILDQIELILKHNLIDIIIIDSVAMINFGEAKVTHAFKSFMSNLAKIVYSSNCSVVIINHLRKTLELTDRKLPFCHSIVDTYASIRIRIVESDKEAGSVLLQIKKNKLWHHLNQINLVLNIQENIIPEDKTL